ISAPVVGMKLTYFATGVAVGACFAWLVPRKEAPVQHVEPSPHASVNYPSPVALAPTPLVREKRTETSRSPAEILAIADPVERLSQLKQLAVVSVAKNPASAFDLAAGMPGLEDREHFLTEAVRAWAIKDPEGALQRVLGFPSGLLRNELL